MNFEEALRLLRYCGEKIRHPSMEDDEYLMGCYVTLSKMVDGKEIIDSIEDAKLRGMSIVKMKGDSEHNMRNKIPFLEYVDLVEKYPYLNEKIIYPTINLLLLMSDDWELTL